MNFFVQFQSEICKGEYLNLAVLLLQYIVTFCISHIQLINIMNEILT